MELILVFRNLWRRRLLVLAGAVLAVAAGYALGPSPTPPRGWAAARAMLDTDHSQLVSPAPELAETLPWRATLAATLLGTDASRSRIASELGIPADQLTVTDLELTTPVIGASLPKAAIKSSFSTAKPYGLTLHTDDIVPLISIAADAPDRRSAERLATAAMNVLKANTETPSNEELLGVRVSTATPVDSVEIPAGKGRKRMVAAAVVLFGMWIAALALIPALLGAARTIRRGSETADAV